MKVKVADLQKWAGMLEPLTDDENIPSPPDMSGDNLESLWLAILDEMEELQYSPHDVISQTAGDSLESTLGAMKEALAFMSKYKTTEIWKVYSSYIRDAYRFLSNTSVRRFFGVSEVRDELHDSKSITNAYKASEETQTLTDELKKKIKTFLEWFAGDVAEKVKAIYAEAEKQRKKANEKRDYIIDNVEELAEQENDRRKTIEQLDTKAEALREKIAELEEEAEALEARSAELEEEISDRMETMEDEANEEYNEMVEQIDDNLSDMFAPLVDEVEKKQEVIFDVERKIAPLTQAIVDGLEDMQQALSTVIDSHQEYLDGEIDKEDRVAAEFIEKKTVTGRTPTEPQISPPGGAFEYMKHFIKETNQ